MIIIVAISCVWSDDEFMRTFLLDNEAQPRDSITLIEVKFSDASLAFTLPHQTHAVTITMYEDVDPWGVW